jgi:CIC family chloride channel protein
VAGVGAALFQILGQVVAHYTLATLAGFTPEEAAGEHSLFQHAPSQLSLPLVVVVMGFGGLISGWLVYTFAPEAEGHGTDAAIDAFHTKEWSRNNFPISSWRQPAQ